jgi:Cytochrome c554 and c-prime
MRRILSVKSWLSLAVLVLSFIAPALCHAAAGPDLTIFFSSDTRGMIRRCGCTDGQLGGLSSRASYIKSHRNDRTLVLDAGDTLFNGLDDPRDRKEFYDLKTSVLMVAMRECGYDVMLPGEYDLEFGLHFLKRKALETGNKLICANLEETGRGKPVVALASSLVKKVGGVRVGITGVIDDKFPYASFPTIFKNIRVKDPLASAKAQIKTLRKKTDFVVCLAHLSVSDPEKFARESSADVVILGHGGDGQNQPSKYGNTLVVKGFYRGKLIGRLDLWLDKRNGNKLKDYKYEAVRLGEDVPPDPQVEKLIADYKQELKKKRFVFTDRTGLKGYFAGPDKCKGCHARSFVNWSSTGHARAFAALEKTGDQYDPECLPCHVTGYALPTGYSGKDDLRNVTCEDCHGAAGAHCKTMRSGHIKPRATPRKGKIFRRVKEKVCTGCHDDYNSPDFDFQKFKEMGGAHRGKIGP